MGELDLKVQMLTVEATRVDKMPRRYSAQAAKLTPPNSVPCATEDALDENVRQNGLMELQLRSTLAAIGKGEGAMRGFSKWICTVHTSLARVQASSASDRPNVLYAHAHLRREYLSGYGIHVGKDRHSILVDEANSDQERGGSTTHLQGDADFYDSSPPSSAP